jgi:hypothetical protein
MNSIKGFHKRPNHRPVVVRYLSTKFFVCGASLCTLLSNSSYVVNRPRRCTGSAPNIGLRGFLPAAIGSSWGQVRPSWNFMIDPLVPRTKSFSCCAIGVVTDVLTVTSRFVFVPLYCRNESSTSLSMPPCTRKQPVTDRHPSKNRA